MSDGAQPTGIEVKRAPGLFSVAEGRSRRLSLIVFAGIGAMVVGRIASGAVVAALNESMIDAARSEPRPALLNWILERPATWHVAVVATMQAWQWALLPALGWLAGRFASVRPLPFAIVALVAGESTSLLISGIFSGLEGALGGTLQLVTRAVLLGLGALVTMLAVRAGAGAASAEGAKAAAWAEAQAEAYRARLGSPADEYAPPVPGESAPASSTGPAIDPYAPPVPPESARASPTAAPPPAEAGASVDVAGEAKDPRGPGGGG